MNKTYFIKIQADGIVHRQLITDKDELEILKAVLKKIEKDATNIIENQPQTNL